jgi:hypothetical protein
VVLCGVGSTPKDVTRTGAGIPMSTEYSSTPPSSFEPQLDARSPSASRPARQPLWRGAVVPAMWAPAVVSAQLRRMPTSARVSPLTRMSRST